MTNNLLIDLGLFYDLGKQHYKQVGKTEVELYQINDEKKRVNDIIKPIFRKIADLFRVDIMEISLFDPADESGKTFYSFVMVPKSETKSETNNNIIDQYQTLMRDNMTKEKDPILSNPEFYKITYYFGPKNNHVKKETYQTLKNEISKSKTDDEKEQVLIDKLEQYDFYIGGLEACEAKSDKPEDRVDRFSQKVIEFLNLNSQESETTLAHCSIAIPILRPVGIYRGKEENRYNGGALILFGTLLENNENKDYKDLVAELQTLITRSLLQVSHREIIKSAIRSAISAIISRNMSHNLGSHVMYYLKLKLGNVYNILREDVLKELFNHVNKNGKINVNEIYISNIKDILLESNLKDDIQISLPFLLGVGRFINYLQERMDYIATISTDYVPYFMPVNFKDAVYDELNYDNKIKRHQNDVEFFKNKMVDNVLLDNIARSEGLKRENIIIMFKNFNGIDTIDKESFDSLEELRKIYIDLPGGQTGRQAIFSIFENIIRNAAKHGGNEIKEKDGKLIIHIEIQELPEYPEFLKFTISDNLGNASTLCDYKEGKISLALNENYIDDFGKMKETNKGIKEMRISACWLRNIRNENTANPRVLNVIKNASNSIAYEFFLLKPQDVAIIIRSIGDFQNIIKDENINIDVINKFYAKFNWKLFTPESYLKEKPRHKIVVVDSELNDTQILEKIIKYSHSRLVYKKLDALFFESIDNEEERKQEYLKLYQEHIEYILKLSGDTFENIYIDDKLNIENDIINLTITPLKYFRKTENSQFNLEKQIIIKEGADYFNKNNICFKKHFLSTANKNDKQIANKTDVKFIESITGNNSTDRLIRKAQFDKLWYYQMNESSQTKIAIFDERLWADFSGISNDQIENYFNPKYQLNSSIIDQIKVHIQGLLISKEVNKIGDLFDFLNKKLFLPYKFEDIADLLNDLFEKKISTDSFIDNLTLLQSNKLDYNNSKINESTALMLMKKNIAIFTLISLSGPGFAIVKHDFINNLEDSDLHNKKNKIIGQIKLNNEGKIEIEHEIDKFHFILIHQGILDKIYQKFNIKNSQGDSSVAIKNEIRDKMNEVTDKLIEQYCFMNKKEEKNPRYIKNLLIHSGRSRPSEEDMPQKVPFIQFSSLENAVNDCKFSLTELIYTAKYDI